MHYKLLRCEIQLTAASTALSVSLLAKSDSAPTDILFVSDSFISVGSHCYYLHWKEDIDAGTEGMYDNLKSTVLQN